MKILTLFSFIFLTLFSFDSQVSADGHKGKLRDIGERIKKAVKSGEISEKEGWSKWNAVVREHGHDEEDEDWNDEDEEIERLHREIEIRQLHFELDRVEHEQNLKRKELEHQLERMERDFDRERGEWDMERMQLDKQRESMERQFRGGFSQGRHVQNIQSRKPECKSCQSEKGKKLSGISRDRQGKKSRR